MSSQSDVETELAALKAGTRSRRSTPPTPRPPAQVEAGEHRTEEGRS